jgi:hypothetical protein
MASSVLAAKFLHDPIHHRLAPKTPQQPTQIQRREYFSHTRNYYSLAEIRKPLTTFAKACYSSVLGF